MVDASSSDVVYVMLFDVAASSGVFVSFCFSSQELMKVSEPFEITATVDRAERELTIAGPYCSAVAAAAAASCSRASERFRSMSQA